MKNLSSKRRRLTLFQLVAATFFMVSGGPYGLEELVKGTGYGAALLILVVTPLIWCIPTALMVGELSSAIPDEGGYYVWVKRALGPFWGFQEAWLSLVASIFDMAIYPTLFVAYLSRLFPVFATWHWGAVIAVSVIAACALWNIRGASGVGRSSLLSGIILALPFLAIILIALLHGHTAFPVIAHADGKTTLLMGILVAMWNYMGWDNASTIASEVENPQRTYPLAMALAVGAITLMYVLSVAAAWYAGVDPQAFGLGGWAVVGNLVAGRWLEVAVVVGGCVSTFGTFNSLVLSYSRVPTALAEDKLLPRVFAVKSKRSGAPTMAIIACSIAWALSLGIGFQRLVQLDIILYSASLVLEFAALAVLRRREPNLRRPFKVPGGLLIAVLIGIPPMFLMGISMLQSESTLILGMNALVFSLILGFAGIPIYWLAKKTLGR